MSQPSRSPSPAILAAIAAGALALSLIVFWSRRAPADLRDWSAADHDQPPGQPLPPASARPKGDPTQEARQEASNLAEMAWARSCAACHGESGRGDGPQGPMVRAPDLTRADWQGRVTDDEILKTIRNGRNNMPKFDLPPAVLDGLVKRIRTRRAR
jgi:cytochrome c oxidase cbb3-type subunit 3